MPIFVAAVGLVVVTVAYIVQWKRDRERLLRYIEEHKEKYERFD